MILLIVTATYTFLIAYALYFVNFRTEYMVKDVLLWFIGSALVTVFNLPNSKHDGHFKKLLIDNLKLIVVFQFLVNTKVFSLTIELIFIPVIAFLVMLVAVAGHKEEYKRTKILTEWILALIGMIFLTLAIIEIEKDVSKFATYRALKSFLLPIALSITFIPYAYLTKLLMSYEMLFVRLNVFLTNKKDLRYAKWRIIRKAFLSIKKLDSLSNYINGLHNNCSRDDIKKVII